MSCGSGLPSMMYSPLLDQVAVVDGDVLALGDQELDRFALFAIGVRSGVILMRRLFL